MHHTELSVWKNSMELIVLTYEFTSKLPKHELYGFVSQMNRAALSIPSNIAEGSSRRSEKDYYRFLEIALGSCFELETQIIILIELNLTKSENINVLLDMIRQEQQMIVGLARKLMA